MSHAVSEARIRYPLRAILAVIFGSLVVLGELATFALFIMPLFPLVPVFVAVMFGNALWMSSLFRWTASLGRPEPVRVRSVEKASEGAPPSSQHHPQAA